VALLAPWVIALIVCLSRPQLHRLGDTGLAVTKAEATWLAAWLLVVVVVAVSSIIRWSGSVQASRDTAEAAYATTIEATSLMTTQAMALPPGDPRANPAVSALLGAQQTALAKRDKARADERRSGLRGLIVGTDGRVSTSKVQAALWTGAVLYAFLFLLIAGWHVWNRPKTPRLINLKDGFAHLIVHPLQPEYLVLLGIPITAAIAAKALTLNKVVAGTLTKTTGTSEGVVAGLAETLSNDTGNADLLDSQYVAFNLITLIYFFSAFFGTTVASPSGGLPSIPPTLLALSGVSAAAYVTKKTLEKGTAPQVLGVAPRLAVLGRDIYLKVTGAGFCANGTPTALNAVTVGGIPVATDSWSDTQVIASLPATPAAARTLGLQVGSQSLVVTDETGNDSDPYLIQITYGAAAHLSSDHVEWTTI
jgi:hypothetical protein